MPLNDYSSRFAAVLLEALPVFRGRLVERPGTECFTVEFQSPSGVSFWLQTEEEERLTVGFDTIHVHFGGWRESVDEEDFAQAIQYIRGIMADEFVVIVEKGRDGSSSAQIIHKTAIPKPDYEFDIKSWSGCPGR